MTKEGGNDNDEGKGFLGSSLREVTRNDIIGHNTQYSHALFQPAFAMLRTDKGVRQAEGGGNDPRTIKKCGAGKVGIVEEYLWTREKYFK